jgi:hypothetical protein
LPYPEPGKIGKHKLQIPNSKQIPMTKIPNSKPVYDLEFRTLKIGIKTINFPITEFQILA